MADTTTAGLEVPTVFGTPTDGFNVIGARGRKADSIRKAVGTELFADDITLPRMLHGRILRSCGGPQHRVSSTLSIRGPRMPDITGRPNWDLRYYRQFSRAPDSLPFRGQPLELRPHFVGGGPHTYNLCDVLTPL